MQTSAFLPYDPSALPKTVVRYLGAQDDGGRSSILDAFADDARVTDEGVTYEGVDAVRRWLSTAAAEFTYETTLIGQRRHSDDTWEVLARLDGNFPGGTARLKYRFVIERDEIAELVIAP